MDDISAINHVVAPQQARSTRFLVRVMEASERILRREGGDGLTMQAVALEAGVSVGGIYRRFQTKQDLVRAIKDRYLTTVEQKLAFAMQNDFQSLGEVIRAFLMNWLQGDDDLFAILMENQPSDAVMVRRNLDSTLRVQEIFEAAVQPFRNEISHPDPDAAITIAFLIAMGFVIRHVRLAALDAPAGPSLDWPDVRRELARAMIAYLQSPAT